MSTATSHCDGNPCQNGGLCTDTGDDFQCGCQNGFSGRICQLGKTFYKIYHRFLFYRRSLFSLFHYFIDIIFFKTGGVLRLVFQPPVEKWSITLWWMSLDSTAHNSLFRCFKEPYCFANEHLLFCSFVLWLYCRITQIKRGNMCASIGLHTSRSLL